MRSRNSSNPKFTTGSEVAADKGTGETSRILDTEVDDEGWATDSDAVEDEEDTSLLAARVRDDMFGWENKSNRWYRSS